jgi:hypothetical protein
LEGADMTDTPCQPRKVWEFQTKIACAKAADECKFYALFGRCINEWLFIDQPFFAFFAFAIGADEESAAKVHYKSQTFGPRKAKTQPRTEGRQSRCPAFGIGGRWRRKESRCCE